MLGPGSYRARPKSRQRVKVWTKVAFPRRRAPAWGLVPGRGAGEHPWDCICGTEGRRAGNWEVIRAHPQLQGPHGVLRS